VTIHEQQAQARRAALVADYRARTIAAPHSRLEFVKHLLVLMFLLVVVAVIAIVAIQQLASPALDQYPVGNGCVVAHDGAITCPAGAMP